MRYDQTTAPAAGSLPVNIDDALTHLRVTDSAEDTLVRRLVMAAARVVERRLSRQLLTATWKLYLETFPDEIELRILPVASVTSITYVDDAGTTQTLSASTYQTDITSPDRPARIWPAYGYTWPTLRADTLNAVTVTFTAGYGTADDVPETIKQAILLLAGHYYEHREGVNVGNIVSEMPEGIRALLNTEEWGSYC